MVRRAKIRLVRKCPDDPTEVKHTTSRKWPVYVFHVQWMLHMTYSSNTLVKPRGKEKRKRNFRIWLTFLRTLSCLSSFQNSSWIIYHFFQILKLIAFMNLGASIFDVQLILQYCKFVFQGKKSHCQSSSVPKITSLCPGRALFPLLLFLHVPQSVSWWFFVSFLPVFTLPLLILQN